MKIIIDGFGLSMSHAGLPVYFRNIIQAINANHLTQEKDITFEILVPPDDYLTEPIQKKGFVKKFALESERVSVKILQYPFFIQLLFKLLQGPFLFLLLDGVEDLFKINIYLWLVYVFSPKVRSMQQGVDAVLFLHQYSMNPNIPGKKIAVVHDVMSWYYYRGGKKQNGLKQYIYSFFLNQLRTFDLIIAVSLSTKADLITEFGMNPDKIQVIYENVSPSYQHFFDARTDPKQQETVSQKMSEIQTRYQLPERYILLSNPFNERKNSQVILQSLPMLEAKNIPIVFISDAKRPREQRIKEKILSLLKNTDLVRFLEIESSEDLAYVYHQALCFCTFSVKEGFGLPPLEALACGTLVVTSRMTTFLEILKDFNVDFVNPFSYSRVEESLKHISELSAEQRKRLIEENDKQMKAFCEKFSWEAISSEMILSLTNTVEQNKLRTDLSL